MWKGRVLQLLGLCLIAAAFVHLRSAECLWINAIIGGSTGILGFSLLHFKPWQGWLAGVIGLAIFIMAFSSAISVANQRLWIDLIGGLLIAFAGWRVVASELSGPWHLKDGPVL